MIREMWGKGKKEKEVAIREILTRTLGQHTYIAKLAPITYRLPL